MVLKKRLTGKVGYGTRLVVSLLHHIHLQISWSEGAWWPRLGWSLAPSAHSGTGAAQVLLALDLAFCQSHFPAMK